MLLMSCGKKSEQDVILDLMAEVRKLVDKKDSSGLMTHFAEDYIDFERRDKGQTETMIRQYFQDFSGIVTHVLSTRIDEITSQEASIQTDVIVSSGGAKLFRKWVKYAGDCYRIRARLVKERDLWKLHFAEWQYVPIEQLLPESTKLLQKIFPNM